MEEIDAATRSRLRLWLRGEKAFGLSRVKWQGSLAAAVQPEPRQERRPEVPVALVARVVQPAVVVAAKKKEEPTLVPPPVGENFTAAPLEREEKVVRLQQLDANEVTGCTRCRLHETRTKTVFGEGDPDAKIFFIGEGPGENEDLTGRPFVGRAGQLLDKMIAGMGLKREQVFVANVVKCRPPQNRVPAPDEVKTCTPYLVREIEIVRPKVIVTLGHSSARYMLDTKLPMGKLRGEWQTWRGIKLMPTFHPSYVLRVYTDEVRKAVWGDLKKVMAEVGLSREAADDR